MIVVITSCAPVRAFRMPGMAPHRAPPRHAARIATSEVQAGRKVHREADVAGEDGAEHQLPLGTDVEQPGTEGEGHAESGADQRRGLDQGVADGVPAADGAGQQRPVGATDRLDDALEGRADAVGWTTRGSLIAIRIAPKNSATRIEQERHPHRGQPARPGWGVAHLLLAPGRDDLLDLSHGHHHRPSGVRSPRARCRARRCRRCDRRTSPRSGRRARTPRRARSRR